MAKHNKVQRRGDIIYIVLSGKPTPAGIDKVILKTKELLQGLRADYLPGLVAVDLSNSDRASSETRLRSKAFFDLNIDKLAVYGARPYFFNRLLYLRGATSQSRVATFNSSQSAERWLLSTDTEQHNNLLRNSIERLVIPFIIIIGLAASAGLWRASTISLHREAQAAASAQAERNYDAVQQRLNTYFNSLYDYRALFAASDSVSQADFHNFYVASGIVRRYPGISAISFIQKTTDGTKTSYPVAYVEPQTKLSLATIGTDLGKLAERSQVFQAAASSDEPVASKTIRLITTHQQGFLATISVNNDGGSGSVFGYINAVFVYKDLLHSVFSGDTDGVSLTDSSNTVVYQQGDQSPRNGVSVRTKFSAGTQSWTIRTIVPHNFNVGIIAQNQPNIVVGSGIIITMLMALIAFELLRSRKYAYELADVITEDLKNTELRHNQMINSVQDYAIFLLDTHGNVASWNKGAEKIKGYKPSEIIGQPIEQFYRPADRAWAQKLLFKAQQNGSAKTQGWRVRKDGSEFWADVVITAIRDDEGKLVGYTKVTRDLTDRKKLEAERDSFIAIATHELKTPITSVKAYAQVLQRRFKRLEDTESAMLMERMDGQLDRLTKLVQDLLDVSKIDNQRLEYTYSDFDPNSFMHNVVEEASGAIPKHSIRLTGEVTGKLHADHYRIQQLLSNLLDNAAKYSSDDTEIAVHYEVVRNKFIVSVTDNGPGIAKSDQKKIFSRFYRTNQSKTIAGFGLGLYLAYEIAKQHQGKLYVESSEGKGSTFYLQLPMKVRK